MRGKKSSPELVYAIMASFAITGSYSETARELSIPVSTARTVVENHIDDPVFAKLQQEKREEFAEAATRIIEKAMKRLEKDIDNGELNIPVNHLTTAIGTLYDKRALARGESTENTAVIVKLPPEAEEYAE